MAQEVFIFDVTPVPKPRMTQRDKWSTDRPEVLRYFAFAEELKLKANLKKFYIGKVVSVIFLIPVPSSWSEKKKADMIGVSHEQKPDASNLLKAFEDALTIDDSKIWSATVKKYWWAVGGVIVVNNSIESGLFNSKLYKEII